MSHFFQREEEEPNKKRVVLKNKNLNIIYFI